MSKKYEITDVVKNVDGHVLHQIRSLVDGRYTHIGQLGGYIESWKNLSQGGNAWIGKDACVYDNARVCQDGLVDNGSKIFESALIYGDSLVDGNSIVKGESEIMDSARVTDHSIVDGHTLMKEFSDVSNHAKVRNAFMSAGAIVSNHAVVDCNEIVALVGSMRIVGKTKITSGNDILYAHAGGGAFTFYRNDEGKIMFSTNYNIPTGTLMELKSYILDARDGDVPDVVYTDKLKELVDKWFWDH